MAALYFWVPSGLQRRQETFSSQFPLSIFLVPQTRAKDAKGYKRGAHCEQDTRSDLHTVFHGGAEGKLLARGRKPRESTRVGRKAVIEQIHEDIAC